MSDGPEPNLIRPYTCVSCGAAMRTRGIDGRCYGCIEMPVQRCRSCYRVRYSVPGDWEDHPGRLPREVRVLCATCGARERKARTRLYYLAVRHAEGLKAKGFGPAAQGVDPFEGMYEEDRRK